MPHTLPAGAARRLGAELAIAWLSLFGLFAVLALLALTIAHDRDDLTAEAAERGRLETLVVADHAARLFEAADLALATVVDDMGGMTGAEITQSRPLFIRLQRLAERLPFLDAIWFHGTDGRLWMTSRTFPAPPEDASDKDFMAAHRAGADIHVSPPVGNTFRLSRPIRSPSGALQGIVSITIDTAFFRGFYAGLNLPPGSTVTLFSAEGLQPLAQQPPPPVGIARIHDPERLRQAIAMDPERGSYHAISPIDHAERIYNYRKVPDFPLYLKISQPLDLANGKWKQQLRTRIATAAAAVTALGALTWLGLRQASNQRRFQEMLSARVIERTRQLEQAVHEVHHRVNNNLQIVTTLLTVQLGRVGDPQVREALMEGIGRIGTIGLAHRVMYGSGAVADLLFGDYLRTLAQQMADLYGFGSGMKVTGENPSLPLETAVPLALLVHELLATGVRPDGPVEIHLGHAKGSWRLVMRNVGLPPPGHLAADLAPLLAAQLGADLRTEEGDGAPVVTLTWRA